MLFTIEHKWVQAASVYLVGGTSVRYVVKEGGSYIPGLAGNATLCPGSSTDVETSPEPIFFSIRNPLCKKAPKLSPVLLAEYLLGDPIEAREYSLLPVFAGLVIRLETKLLTKLFKACSKC